ncbi:MAG: hypothetical protein JJT78_14620 [Leptospira sp.]|nr:hypothetical protein [Leptospira sp.]
MKEYNWLNLVNYLILFFFISSNLGCFFHYTHQEYKYYRKHIEKLETELEIQLPIKIKLDRSNIPEYIPEWELGDKNRKRKIDISSNFLDKKRQSKLIENYYSEEILSKFKMNDLFVSNPDSNILILIKPTPKKIEYYDPQILWAYTLGVIPNTLNTFGEIVFEIYDLDKKQMLKSYKYNLIHIIYYKSMTVVLLSPFIFSEQLDHSTDNRTFSIMRRAFQLFHNDFSLELQKNPKLKDSFYINKSPHYSLELVRSKNESFENILHSFLESTLVSKGFQVYLKDEGIKGNAQVDRTIYIEGVDFNRTINKKKSMLKIQYTAKCRDNRTGKLLWDQYVSYESDESNLSQEDIIQNSVIELFNLLSRDGII